MEKNSKLHIGWLVTAMMVVLLIIDQIIKLYIKTHFCLGESVRVTDWFYIEFVENNGMAWGMSFIGKFWLSLLRLVAICALSIYLHRIIKRGTYRLLYIVLVALVLTGAIGNMIDRVNLGYVVDFIYVSAINFPIFNVADCYVTVATILLALVILFYYQEEDLAVFGFKKKENKDGTK